MKAIHFAKLEALIEKWTESVSEDGAAPSDFFWPEKLAERMARASEAVFDGAVESQEDRNA